MSATTEPAKTPLDFALDQTPLADVREKVLKLAHALTSTCLTQTMMESAKAGRPPEEIAADAKAYARQLHELEKHLGAGYSNVPNLPAKTQYVRKLPATP